MTEMITTTDADGSPVWPPPSSPSPRHGAVQLAWAAAWGVAAVLAWIAFSRRFGITFPARFTVMLQALLPLVFLAVYPLAVVAFVRRRWALGAMCVVLAIVHVLSVYPALGSRSLPDWAASAPRVTVLEANMYDGNGEPQAAAAKIMASDADVLVLVELEVRTLTALRNAGIDDVYPYSTVPRGRNRADGIWSKTPITAGRPAVRQGYKARATVTIGGRPLELFAVHVDNAIRGRDRWSGELAELGAVATSLDTPVALVGDFNATRWNPPFGDLLGSGLRDGHEATGQGLSRSWPRVSLVPIPLMRLDHAVVNDRVGVVSMHDYTIPGSDHRGFVTELAIGT
jgi:endonuclease/exonuclease/phosphatase (EEP) superfamily protein YafD